MASMHLVRPEKSASRHGEALVDADHTIKMCFNPATAHCPPGGRLPCPQATRGAFYAPVVGGNAPKSAPAG